MPDRRVDYDTSVPQTWRQPLLAWPTGSGTARIEGHGFSSPAGRVFVLPHDAARAMAWEGLADAIVQAGGTALMIESMSRDRAPDAPAPRHTLKAPVLYALKLGTLGFGGPVTLVVAAAAVLGLVVFPLAVHP